MSEINLIEDNLWDHYSGLPNPAWYQYKKQLNDEEEERWGFFCFMKYL
jgi:hypothetical protein